MSGKRNKTDRVKKKRVRIYEVTRENDIRYRGPLSYFHFQILGWLCIVLVAVQAMMNLGGKISEDLAVKFASWDLALGIVSSMSLPFLLLVNFARILNNEEGYKNQLLRNFGAMMGIFLGVWLFYDHFFVGTVSAFATNPADTKPVLNLLISRAAPNGFLAINIFVDLFLCTLFMFFLNYRPTKFFTGGKLYLFRAFAILPIAYEVASIMLKATCAEMKIVLPVWTFPLLTVKPPMTFFVFVLMSLFIKFRELRYCRHGRTHEDYEAFLKTNRNSLHFSIFLTVMLAVAAVADFAIMLMMMIKQAGSVEALDSVLNNAEAFYPTAVAIGFGKSWPLLLVAPIMLLYSYTRKPKFEKFGMLSPVVAIVLIVFVVIQGAYQILHVANIPRINYLEIRQTIAEAIQSLMASE